MSSKIASRILSGAVYRGVKLTKQRCFVNLRPACLFGKTALAYVLKTAMQFTRVHLPARSIQIAYEACFDIVEPCFFILSCEKRQ